MPMQSGTTGCQPGDVGDRSGDLPNETCGPEHLPAVTRSFDALFCRHALADVQSHLEHRSASLQGAD
jgi:hypothetical protein